MDANEFLRRVDDLADRAERRGIVTRTGFLTPAEQYMLRQYYKDDNLVLTGGQPDCVTVPAVPTGLRHSSGSPAGLRHSSDDPRSIAALFQRSPRYCCTVPAVLAVLRGILRKTEKIKEGFSENSVKI